MAQVQGAGVRTGVGGVGGGAHVWGLVPWGLARVGRVGLGAPTGRGGKRRGEVGGLGGGDARAGHRLLGAGPQGFRHGSRQPLPFDVVVVDEASMLRFLYTGVGT